ncbi:acyl-CoA dehydrogenase family protein [Ferrovibrio sp.]|uniref:acyl-CoA dehydrogenase family protein n=1 Tax=Ferrovibrio sp. TaxID=1917215 RepID=UPI0035B128C4
MAAVETGLAPADFIDTAARAVAACASLSLAGRMQCLAADGLLGLMAPESVGGLGLDAEFAAPVLEAAGDGLLDFPLLETMLSARALDEALPQLAEQIIAGTASITIAWSGAAKLHVEGSSFRLDASVGKVPHLDEVDWLLLPLEAGGAAVVSMQSAGLEKQQDIALEQDQAVWSAQLRDVVVQSSDILPQEAWSQLQADAHPLRAAVMLGAGEACLRTACDYVSVRRQFGRPLAAFQAIRHMLARSRLTLDGVRRAIQRSLWPVNARNMQSRHAAFVAASAHCAAAAEAAIQAHGGMGFTWDVPLHRYLRRIRMLEQQGNAPAMLDEIGRLVVAGLRD